MEAREGTVAWELCSGKFPHDQAEVGKLRRTVSARENARPIRAAAERDAAARLVRAGENN